jgi:alkanesulfonate monooxygenase SsuD/methylene tetrahydromethanopterin reductase-like flavin-dependent oxidoreductase (luciferase family)
MMKFGLFFLCERPPWQSQRSAYHDAIDQAVYADALGFDAVWIAEHHFSGRLPVELRDAAEDVQRDA